VGKSQCIWDEPVFTLPEEETAQAFDLDVEDESEEEDRVVPKPENDQMGGVDDREGKSLDVQNKQVDHVEMDMKKRSVDNNNSLKDGKDIEVVVDRPIPPPAQPASPDDRSKSSPASQSSSFLNGSVSSTQNYEGQLNQNGGNKVGPKVVAMNVAKGAEDSAVGNGNNILNDDEDAE